MEKELVLEIINSSIRASQYMRAVVLGITIAVVMVGISAWNSFQTSWAKSRVMLVENILKWNDPICKGDSLPPELFLVDTCFNVSNKGAGDDSRIDSSSSGIQFTTFQVDTSFIPRIKKGTEKYESLIIQYRKAKAACETEAINCDKASLYTLLGHYQQARIERVLMVNVPFFNVPIDVNDLNLFAGFGFMILLYLLMYTIELRRNALQAVVEVLHGEYDIEPNEIALSMKLIGVHQVLSLRAPESTGFKDWWIGIKETTGSYEKERYLQRILNEIRGFPIKKLLEMGPLLLYTLPVLLHSLILIHDYATWSYGELLSDFDTVFVFGCGLAFFMCNLILTAYVFAFFKDINRILNFIRDEVQ